MHKCIWLFILLSASFSLNAACTAAKNTIFQCQTVNQKVLQLCDDGQYIQYIFGRPPHKIELKFTVPRTYAKTWQWQGYGRAENYSVSLIHAKTRYRIFSSFDKIDQIHRSGVEVEQANRLVATVYCNQHKPIINRLMGINLAIDE